MKRIGCLRLWPVLIALACARNGEPGPDEAVASTVTDVVTSLEVKVAGEAVELILHATNPTSAPVTLEFNTAQRYDFAVLGGDGREVWRWSGDRMFAQVTGRVSLGAGESVQHRETWQAGGRRGAFVAVGRIPARGRTLEARADFVMGQ